MKKREYKEQERQRRYYFFDYLFWLGEMAWMALQGRAKTPQRGVHADALHHDIYL
ncbi:MAG: hypothetical protein ACLTOV_12865 [Phocaeicola sp.]